MPTADIRIVRRTDPPPLADLDQVIHVPDARLTFVLLEGGMSSGKPSVAIVVPLPDGSNVLVETSMEILGGAVVAARAAFPEVFAGGPLQV